MVCMLHKVVVEVYASHDLAIKPHLLLSLVLYKMVDPQSVSSITLFIPLTTEVVAYNLSSTLTCVLTSLRSRTCHPP